MARQPPITPARARELITQILGSPGEDPERAEALFELLSGISSPTGDVEYYEVAQAVARMIFPHTPAFETAFQQYQSGEFPPDVDDNEKTH
jgi:hypothetical protein